MEFSVLAQTLNFCPILLTELKLCYIISLIISLFDLGISFAAGLFCRLVDFSLIKKYFTAK
jgi:hypothetical protein